MELNSAYGWEQWYAQEEKSISNERIYRARNIHMPFLNKILSQNTSLAIEIGIGTGMLGYSLSQLATERGLDLEIIELDYCFNFLQDAKIFRDELKTSFINADTFNLPFDSTSRNNRITFHQGLLEHFTDEEIISMLSEQLRISKTIIATIPSHEYAFKEGLRGDERLMPIEDWIALISRKFNVDGFYYGMLQDERYHICLTIND